MKYGKLFSPGITVNGNFLFGKKLKCPIAWRNTAMTVCYRHAVSILQQLSLWTPAAWKYSEYKILTFFWWRIFRLKLYLRDRILADTARVPINQHSCEDTDWHSCLGRSDPLVPRSAHLGCKENQSRSSLKDKPKENLRFWGFFPPQLQKFTVTIKNLKCQVLYSQFTSFFLTKTS